MICGYGGDLDGGNGGGADEPKCDEDIRKMPHIVAATSETYRDQAYWFLNDQAYPDKETTEFLPD